MGTTTAGVYAIVGICAVVLVMGFLRQKAELVLNFAVRSLLGGIGIYVVNGVLEYLGFSIAVGINPISILTVGSLGLGGFGLLYAILFFQML